LYQIFEHQNDFTWKKFDHKVVYLDENYNFHIKLISVQIHKKVVIFENRLSPIKRRVGFLQYPQRSNIANHLLTGGSLLPLFQITVAMLLSFDTA
jgi:hypothetical protein